MIQEQEVLGRAPLLDGGPYTQLCFFANKCVNILCGDLRDKYVLREWVYKDKLSTMLDLILDDTLECPHINNVGGD